MQPTQSSTTPTLRLKPLEVEGYSRPIELSQGRLRLGRAEDNDVTLSAELFPSVSLHHCELVQVAGRLELSDLGSRNGTLVNGKAVARTSLQIGDVVQLGALGPRFLVTTSNPLAETMFVDPKQLGMGSLTKEELKEALGVPQDVAGVEELVQRRSRTNLLRVLLLLVLASLAVGLWSYRLWRDREADHAQIAALNESVQDSQRRHEDLQKRREEDLARVGEQAMQSRRDLEAERSRLEEGRRALQERIDKLEREGTSSAGDLGSLRSELEATRKELETARAELRLLNPVDLEQTRLTDVARVRSAIVLLEAVTTIIDVESGKTLYITDPEGAGRPNFEDQGVPLEFESTGSGFCVSEQGYILTNAHVVLPMEDDPFLSGASGLPVRPKVTIQAVFSGTAERHSVEVVSVANAGTEDLALVRIEPFAGMPYIADFDVEAPLPAPGEDVYLFGFPLGNFALQQGDTVIASTFRGIVSRLVDGKLQVDAGVHPGNSGGPVTDERGRVVGVVTSVQALPDQSAVYAIGYALPIADAKKLWPLR